jgi:murein DD-endopeptidase MepM/ murein hydrolase activator NlpD
LPPKRPAPRHAAPGGFSPRRAAALPLLLLTAAGGAFAGLALVPTAVGTNPPRVTAAQALAPVEISAPAVANEQLAVALEQGRKAAFAKPAAPPSGPARASRSRQQPAATAASDTDGRFARPGAGRLTSGYGRRWGRLHAGIDLAAGMGSPVRAAAAGVVLSARSESGYGKVVRVRHPDGTVTVYAHMSAPLVDAGERVRAGDLVGREGNTGRSTGPHLHFEVRVNGTPVNPLSWLRKRGVDI